MAKVVDTYRDSGEKVVFISDLTPPRSGDPTALDAVKGLDVDFVCVAYSPGKLVRMSSEVAAHTIRSRLSKNVVFNLAPRDMNKIALGSYLLGAQTLGLENVIVLQGDDFSERDLAHGVKAVGDYTSTGLIRSICAMNEGLDYRGAKLRAPTDFCVGATLDLSKGLSDEVRLAHRKVEAGAQFFITQPIYELGQRDRFLELYEAEAQEPLSLPVFWGLQVLEKDGLLLGNAPPRVLQELEGGRPGTDIALELLQSFVGADIQGIYLVPPILRGGARDYEAAQRVLEAFRR